MLNTEIVIGMRVRFDDLFGVRTGVIKSLAEDVEEGAAGQYVIITPDTIKDTRTEKREIDLYGGVKHVAGMIDPA